MELAGHWGEAIWETWAEMHPRTAAEAGVGDGERVRIISELGQIEVRTRVIEAIMPGVVAVAVGLGHEVGSTSAHVGANPNAIVETTRNRDPTLVVEAVTRVNVERI